MRDWNWASDRVSDLVSELVPRLDIVFRDGVIDRVANFRDLRHCEHMNLSTSMLNAREFCIIGRVIGWESTSPSLLDKSTIFRYRNMDRRQADG